MVRPWRQRAIVLEKRTSNRIRVSVLCNVDYAPLRVFSSSMGVLLKCLYGT